MKYLLVAALVGLVGCGSSPTAPASNPQSLITNPQSLTARADWSSLVGTTWTGTATATLADGSKVTWPAYLQVAWGSSGNTFPRASGLTNQWGTILDAVERDRVATVEQCSMEGHWTNLRASASALSVEVPDMGGCQYRAVRWDLTR